MTHGKWTEADQQAAFEALSADDPWPDDTSETERDRECRNAAGAVLRAVAHRLAPHDLPQPEISRERLDAMERDGWTPQDVRALIADYKRIAYDCLKGVAVCSECGWAAPHFEDVEGLCSTCLDKRIDPP